MVVEDYSSGCCDVIVTWGLLGLRVVLLARDSVVFIVELVE